MAARSTPLTIFMSLKAEKTFKGFFRRCKNSNSSLDLLSLKLLRQVFFKKAVGHVQSGFNWRLKLREDNNLQKNALKTHFKAK